MWWPSSVHKTTFVLNIAQKCAFRWLFLENKAGNIIAPAAVLPWSSKNRRHSLVCLCFSHDCQFFDVIDPTWFPTSYGLAFPSPPRKTASSSLTDGQSVLPLLVLLTFGGSIHGSFYLNQPEALYATPTTRMILFVLCHLMSSFLYPKELCSTRAISPAVSSVSGWYLMPTTTQLSGGISCNCQSSTNLW